MGFKAYLIFLSTLIVIHYSYGCQMDSVPNWLLPQHIEVLDIFRGEVFASNTATITGINTVSMSPQLNRGPYFDFVYADSRFLIRTNDAYADYEEYETEQSITATVVFNCEGSTTRPMVFVIDIQDTNNNDPLFRPSTELEFTVIPPLPPGFQITGCWNDIYARDIDLTTQRVDFEIFDSTYFAIAYDQASSTVPKEFRASLTTTTFIRSIPEPIEFRISATDVDLTGDPRRTTFATIRIKSDGEFELPDEPVFSQTFYRGTYTEDHQVVLQETISLRQGYHEEVQFSLGEEYSQYFSLTNVANQISIHVDNQLPAEILIQQQIILVVNAERTHTSGASTTVILQLPEEEVLVFQQSSYTGSIIDNALQLSELILTQGYSGDPVTVQIISEYASYFSHTVQQNRITLAMTPLPATVIEQNNFLNLQVVASTTRNSASTIVTLEIVKDDGVTPVFQRNLYEGTYDSEAGLSLEQIVLVQGYDATVQANLRGEHAALFQLIQDGPNFNLRVSRLPTELFREANLLLTLEATKPRTVGANTAISIALPAETQLEFERQNYEGIIEDNVLQLTQLILTQGYDSDTVSVRIQDGPAHASYFTPSIVENRIAISMTPLPANIIQSNTFLNLEVVASTDRSTASAIVTLEIISDDAVTPVFQHALYEGTYNPTDGLTLGQIVLVQGFDETVRLNLQGEHASHFQIDQNGVNINIRTTSLPSELFRESTILLTLEATKPRTVGANTAISITLPAEIQLEFEQQNYKGVIEDNVLELTQLILRQGYENEPVSVRIQDGSAHASYFTSTIVGNRITLTMSTLPADIIQSNAFLNLEVVASTDRSSASTIVTLEIISDDVITPVFERGLYEGTYDPTGGLTLNEIVIVQGFDATVQLNLTGEHANLFGLVQEGGTTRLSVNYVPAELFRERNILLTLEATKPRTVGANAAISIALPTDRELRFAAETYRGTIRDDDLTIETIVLNVGYDDDVIFTLSGDYTDYFIITSLQNQVSLVLLERPQIAENNILPITLTASAMNAISTSTTIILEIIQDDTITPQFARNIYFGKYTETSNVEIEPISLIQGFDETVSFHLDGEHSQYFEITIEDNTVLLTLHSSIPSQVIYDEKVLTFSILAERELTVGAAAAISISFPTELTHPTNLRFSKNIYVGEIENNYLYLENIILEHGFTASTEFTLTGEYSSYFTFTSVANVVTISAANVLPSEVLNQKFITLELAADGLRAIPSTTVIVIDVKQPVIVPPVFNEAYYRGIYTVGTGLRFEEEISLSEAFNTSVSLELIGAHSQWFELIYDGLVVKITTRTGLPQDVLENNHNLLFTLVATRPGATSGIAVIFIDLPKEVPAPIVISFTQASFVGQIVEGSLDLPPVTLNRGYDLAIQLIATGEFASYFTLIRESNVITIRMNTDLPSEVFDAHAFVVLDIEASYPEAVSGHTTVVIELTRAPSTKIMTPVFEQAYYIGQYSDEGGLLFEQTFRLIQGFDETVSFTLIGDNSQAFNLVEIEPNAFTLSLREDLTENLNDYRLLVFSVVASKPGSLPGHAAIVITLTGKATDSVLSFDRINYVGTIEDNSVDLGPITLSKGFTSAVTFTLHGDLAEFFSINSQGALVSIVLQQPIPQESIPANRVILLELQATAPPALPAFATIVLEVLQDDDNLQISPVFAETFYVGSYSASGSFVFDPVITLAEGYDQTIVFALEGEQSQWFGITRSENSVRLVLTSPIPPAVIANNQHLLFMITAQRPGSTIARATIVIQLNDEIAADEVLGFDRINYVGTIEDNSVDLGPITLSEGFTSAVTFTLHGDLADFFSINTQGALVTIVLQQPIPQDSIPANRVILLELQATAPPALPAFATIVLEVLQDDDNLQISPVFAETFYVGSYSASGSFVFDPVITLAEGYDQTIVFALEGEQSQWFGITRSENSVRLVLTSPIPPAVIANNQHLLFMITAQRPGSTIARATIVIQLNDEIAADEVLGFDRINYVGTIEDNSVDLGPITLSEGFTSAVTFTLHGDLADFFSINSQGALVSIVLQQSIPQESIPANRVILLELQATAPPALPAFATIVLEVLQDDDNLQISPVFAKTFYVGSYSASGSFVFDPVITLAEGYDQTIVFALEGEQSQWFGITRSENSVRLVLTSPIPPAVIANNQHLLFMITAQRPGSTIARATIVIQLNDEIAADEVLGFDRINYVGTIEDNSVDLGPITLSEGFTSAVTFTLHGDLADFFSINSQGALVSIVLQQSIPQESIPANRVILLELQATAPPALPAFATIVLEVLQDDDNLQISPVFAETFYVGSYSASGSFVFDPVITLAEGYDQTIVFALEGEQSQWFGITRSENSVRLVLTSPIPPAVIANNQHLLFMITAQRPGSTIARATIVIQLNDEIAADEVLGFDRINYVGTIEDNSVDLGPITLSEGFTSAVTFTLHGDLADFFSINTQGALVTIVLQQPIPQESIPANRVILLELQATAAPALPAFATIVLEVLQDDDNLQISPVFAETFYVGSYSASGSFVFDPVITLAEGYDQTIVFALEGEQSQWFGITRSENSVRLVLTSPIPPAVIANNQHLLFMITAQRSGSTIARATIVIQLNDEIAADEVLGFDRINYVGTIEDNSVDLGPITLSEGFTSAVTFTLHGDLADFFSINTQGALVTIVLQQPIPQVSIPANRVILLELQATAAPALPAFATIVLEVLQDDDNLQISPVFAETFYVGSYSASGSFVFDPVITLAEGYDQTIVFALEGEQSQWFGITRSENSVRLVLTSPIPPAVIANNQHLLFMITAQRPGSTIARATIVIQLNDEIAADEVLGFDRINYVGTIEDNSVDLGPITLSEGFTSAVTFTLHGDLADFFSINSQGALVSIVLQQPIPQESIPANRVILLELQATAAPALPAFATIVLEVLQDDDNLQISPVFAETFYVGSYSASGSFVFDPVITLAEGYDQTIVFALEGEQSQWFGITRSENSVRLVLTSPIPPAVIANNQHLLFMITAQRPGSTIARATIVIQLNDEIAADEVLGFDRINYVGTIEDNSVDLGPITLSEGFTSAVTFTLHGDLANFFSINTQGALVTIVLQQPIPQVSIPANRVILLELQATAAPALPAFATIVLEVLQDDDNLQISPVFAETFYVGSYSASGSFVFDPVITLAEGYDQTIVFALEGEQSQWFGITRSENSVRLVLTSPIPPAVIANNQHLLFIITAQRPGSTIARATIVIQLNDEIAADEVLGFDRINYVGTIEDNSVDLGPITLSEGFTSAVTFTLHGDLADFFSINSQGALVSIVLQQSIPQESIPANRVILLELQATAPPALPAFATIVLEVLQDDDNLQISPVFAETFYVGSYSASGSFVFDPVITLAEGYDQTIVFALEGEQSQWFGITRSENSVRLVLTSPIPPAVIANNQHLLFMITAQRPGSTIARATIVIQLNDEIAADEVLGFDRINYVGTIEDNSVDLGPITLSEGFTSAVAFTLHGDLADFFSINSQGALVSIVLQQPIPQVSIPANRVILLELQATAPPALPAFATIVLEVLQDDDNLQISPVFAETFYVGSYSASGSFVFDPVITLAEGYDQTIVFALEGEQSQWFGITRSENSVRLVLTSPIPPAVIANNQHLLFEITAQRPGSTIARATIVIQLNDEIAADEVLGFDRINYVGIIEDNSVDLGPITLSEGFTSAVTFTLHGDLADFFSINSQGALVSIVLQQPIPQESIPANRVILLELQATAPPALPAFATIVLEVLQDDDSTPILSELVFDRTYYTGTLLLNGNLIFETPSKLIQGYDDFVVFTITGDHASHFTLSVLDNSVTVELFSPLSPDVIADNQKLIFILIAERPGSRKAEATIIITIERDVTSVIFDRILYEGRIQNGVVQHSTITISGYEGTNINLVGEYALLFRATLSNGVALVQAAGELPLPADVRHVVLELRVADSGAVLILQVSTTEGPVLPVVSFDSSSYAVRVEMGQTGLVGRVQASADNDEAITYSLVVNNEHLRGRISINTAGELRLSAPPNSGVYNFYAVATTVFSQATGQATIHLSVDAITICDVETVTAPLIIVDRDEEEPQRDLVLLNASEHAGCRYTLTNLWPVDQNWLYVDETGLHATAIDREDPSIAFMALSQIRVELILTCDSDTTRIKRSIDNRLDWLGPYDYGTNTWILGESIVFNPRRSIVNLIVNDINDNTPIFVGKENEPIVVGYPVPELEETVLPRSLVELQATDADVGINAALVYWSSEPQLAVSPTTGFVHVRNDQRLDNDQILAVNATDLNGEGLTGSITIKVKLLDTSNIAVITVRDAFLEDENSVLGNISNVIGYEVRPLRSVVISNSEEEESSRMKREVPITEASLEIYVYGLIQTEPVSVERLTNDINNAADVAVNIANIQSLQDHLDGRLICDDPGRDTGLLVATIVLSILLFILIVAIVVWFVLKRIKKRNYDEFSDVNSLASQNESLGQPPKPLDAVAVAKPRLNIEELKRSEKRLQDMLNAPVTAEPSSSSLENVSNSVTKIPLPDPLAPIVIQDKLKDAVSESDDDEFGERKKPRRKSVVTFNENVEKIIHVDEEPDVVVDPNMEVYKL